MGNIDNLIDAIEENRNKYKLISDDLKKRIYLTKLASIVMLCFCLLMILAFILTLSVNLWFAALVVAIWFCAYVFNIKMQNKVLKLDCEMISKLEGKEHD